MASVGTIIGITIGVVILIIIIIVVIILLTRKRPTLLASPYISPLPPGLAYGSPTGVPTVSYPAGVQAAYPGVQVAPGTVNPLYSPRPYSMYTSK